MKIPLLVKACGGVFLSVMASNAVCQQERNEHAEPVVIFSHGIADTYRQAFRYYNLGIIKKPFYSFNFADATDSIVRVNRAYSVFAQEEEIAHLHKAYDIAAQRHQGSAKVLYGVSRGASTICTYMALHKPSDVQAVILESPFASIDDVVEFVTQKKPVGMIPGIKMMAKKIFSTIFPRYNWSGIRPIDLVREIPKNIPMLLICTKTDQLVPYTTTVNLFNALLEVGCDAHLVVLDGGEHAKLFFSDQWTAYQVAVHAFYKRCGLPYSTYYAELAE